MLGSSRLFAAATTLAVFAGSTQAAMLSVFNTGEAPPGSADPNYTLVSTPDGGPVDAYVATSTPGTYAPEGTGMWIGPVADLTGDETKDDMLTPGLYIYETTFEIEEGDDPSTAVISGFFAADNSAEIYLNGVSTGITTDTFAELTEFSITDGFELGENTLSFYVTQGSGQGMNPTALLVTDVDATVEPQSIPEPTSLALVGLGGLGFFALRRRRKADDDA